MALPCREQIVQAVATVLGTIAGVDGFDSDHVHVRRVNTVSEEDLPALVIRAGSAVATGDFTGERGYVLTLLVEGAAKSSADPGSSEEDHDESAQQNAEALRAKVMDKLFGDVTLSGKSRDIRLAESPEADRSDIPSERVAGFVDAYEIDFATSETDATAFA